MKEKDGFIEGQILKVLINLDRRNAETSNTFKQKVLEVSAFLRSKFIKTFNICPSITVLLQNLLLYPFLLCLSLALLGSFSRILGLA